MVKEIKVYRGLNLNKYHSKLEELPFASNIKLKGNFNFKTEDQN